MSRSDAGALVVNPLFANMITSIHEEIYRTALGIAPTEVTQFRSGVLTGLRRVLELMSIEEKACLDLERQEPSSELTED